MHTSFLRHSIEESYAEIVLENEVNPNLHEEGLKELILERCNHLCEIYGTENVVKEIADFALCVDLFEGYAWYSIAMRYIKNVFIDLLHQNYDPDDPAFEQHLTKAVHNDRSIQKTIVRNSNGYNDNPATLVSAFMRDVRSGTTDVPTTKPYFNYVPTERAKEILKRHTTYRY